VKLPICLALTALLSACIPIGIRGTSIVDAGAQHPAAVPIADPPAQTGQSGQIADRRRA